MTEPPTHFNISKKITDPDIVEMQNQTMEFGRRMFKLVGDVANANLYLEILDVEKDDLLAMSDQTPAGRIDVEGKSAFIAIISS